MEPHFVTRLLRITAFRALLVFSQDDSNNNKTFELERGEGMGTEIVWQESKRKINFLPLLHFLVWVGSINF